MCVPETHKLWFLRMSERPDCPLAAGRWVQSVWWVLIGSVNLDGFDSGGSYCRVTERYGPVSLFNETVKDFFSLPKGDKMRNENRPRIICIQLLSEREEGVFKNDNAASGMHQAWLWESVKGVVVWWWCTSVCVCVCGKVHLPLFLMACVCKEERGRGLVNIRPNN